MSIRNFKLKHIALGLVLAGVSSSSAWAISVQTHQVIKGHKPYVVSIKKAALTPEQLIDDLSASNQKAVGNLSVHVEYPKTLKEKGQLKTGDELKLHYKMQDYEGDTDAAKGDTAAGTVVLYYKDAKTGVWAVLGNNVGGKNDLEKEIINLSGTTTVNQGNGETTISFVLPEYAAGVKEIGFSLKVKSQYGEDDDVNAPDNNWLVVRNILAKQSSPAVLMTQASRPTDYDKWGFLNTDMGTDPVPDPDKPISPIPTEGKIWVAIVSNNVADTEITESNDLSSSKSTLIPRVGETYKIVSWRSASDTKEYTKDKDAINTELLTWDWYLATSGAAKWGESFDYDVKVADNKTTYEIKTNRLTEEDTKSKTGNRFDPIGFLVPMPLGPYVNQTVDGLKMRAGAQGYKLKVVERDSVIRPESKDKESKN